MNDKLRKAREAVREIQKWLNDIDEHGPNDFEEAGLAMDAYIEAAQTFFELWDEENGEAS